MIILLPPSETKRRPDGTGANPDESFAEVLEHLAEPGLAPARTTMLRAAERTARARGGAEALGVPVSSPELVERMAQLGAEPVGAPLDVYSGVLYEQLGDLARDRIREAPVQVLIQSALLGVVDAARDRIPAYRVSASSRISRLGPAGAWWRRRLAPLGERIVRETERGASPLVIDCRSGAYRAMMPVRTPGLLEVAPVQERAGRRRVISHDAKRYRGWVARVLLEQPEPPTSRAQLQQVLRTALAGTLDVEIDGDRLVIVDRAD